MTGQVAIDLPQQGTWVAWRDAARALMQSDTPPECVIWSFANGPADLFAAPLPAQAEGQITVSKAFVAMAQTVIWHSDPERFARLYAFLWRMRTKPQLMIDRADPDLARLRQLEKNVRRCQHKMKAFVRFRELPTSAARRKFAAWFEPTHFTVEPTAPFFARRFADMDWMIATPDATATFEDGKLSFHGGCEKPDLPEDATEDLWGTYFCNIFNPARVKLNAMQSEMPKKYWKNMPETRHIPELIATAEARVREMQLNAPSLPPLRAARISERLQDQRAGSAETGADLKGCTACPLHANATQVVPGEGPPTAELMFVGEQPGDQEDLAGRPFVGPAGQVFDAALTLANIERDKVFVTNAVKHFKFKPRGRRRIHQRPSSDEVQRCKWWLDAERAQIKPKVIVALGATAAEALTGSGKDLLKRRGQIELATDGTPIFITVHPSYLLRLTDKKVRAAEQIAFENDFRRASEIVAQLRINAP
ncbi:UdgX family uracil-DNA binding protein [Litoreibacter roseus]|uniref:Type-4 uracil-DNA glycosylase n=1 Tax=Litoreibacter roseus TaxID=2601869 RepID=A0A6N6JAP8_9RHOB|nr:UdgX family uracil-DNA binding protein [Litoreibacter roseus]GFE63114.1 uracil-DNA glycosylase [Litoreibacter roseus]